MRRYFSNGSKTIGPKDINKNGQIESWEEARAKGMAKGMGKEYVDRAEAKKGGSMYHTTKDGRKARKGLYYYYEPCKKIRLKVDVVKERFLIRVHLKAAAKKAKVNND
jgi:hypothetical protein